MSPSRAAPGRASSAGRCRSSAAGRWERRRSRRRPAARGGTAAVGAGCGGVGVAVCAGGGGGAAAAGAGCGTAGAAVCAGVGAGGGGAAAAGAGCSAGVCGASAAGAGVGSGAAAGAGASLGAAITGSSLVPDGVSVCASLPSAPLSSSGSSRSAGCSSLVPLLGSRSGSVAWSSVSAGSGAGRRAVRESRSRAPTGALPPPRQIRASPH